MNNSLLDSTDDGSPLSNVNDINVLRPQIKEQQIRLEACFFLSSELIHSTEDCITFQNELDQMRKKLNETEMKNARVVHDVCFRIPWNLTSSLTNQIAQQGDQ